MERVQEVSIPKEIILIDDCSSDGTRELLKGFDKQNNIKVLFHDKNQGNGATLRTGIQNVRGDMVIIQNADLEYDPGEYRRLIQPIVENRVDVVFRFRFQGNVAHRVLYYWHYVGNRVLTTISNMTKNLNLTDMETCYKVSRRELLQRILPTLKQDRFAFEPESTAKVARPGQEFTKG